MKIALCISGSTRNYRKCLPTIKDNIEKKLNCDTFIYVPEDRHSIELEKFLNEKWKSVKEYRIIKDTPIDGIDLKCIPSQILNYPGTEQQWYQQLYGIYSVYNLAKTYQEYDWYIRCRPDHIVSNIPDIKLEGTSIIYVPSEESHSGINDGFGICDKKAMYIYGNMINILKNKIFKSTTWGVEDWVLNVFKMNNINVKQIPFPNMRRIKKDEWDIPYVKGILI